MKRLKNKNDLDDLLANGQEYFLPNNSVDCVIFGFHESQLKVLLLKWKNQQQWCLPGGFIYRDEDVDDSAKRILFERTGLQNIFLKQFYTFGSASRQRLVGDASPVKIKKGSWISNRFVTIGYWSLVEFSSVKPTPDFVSDDCRWWEVNKLPKLMLDHESIVKKALESLQINLNDYPVGHDLLPSKFTMPELQVLYETILNKKLDRRNFQKKIIALDILERLDERKLGGAHKAPYYYRFDKKKYQRAMKQGLKFGI